MKKSILLGVVLAILISNPIRVSALTYEEEMAMRTESKKQLMQSSVDTDKQIEEEIWLGELELLANLVEAEAGNQDLRGKRLVADVVLNRVDSEDYPNTITEVIYQKNQFAVMSDGAFEKASWNVSEESFQAVWMEANGDRLDNSIYFFTAEKYGKYGTQAYSHGNHFFCY